MQRHHKSLDDWAIIISNFTIILNIVLKMVGE